MTLGLLDTSNRIEANPGDRNLLKDYTGAALDASVLPASSGTWLLSAIVGVRECRKLRVELQYDAHASTTTGSPLVRVWTSAKRDLPLYTDDVWSGPLITDGSLTATAVAGTKATGLAEAHGPLQGLQVHRELTMQVPAVVANSAKLRMHFTLNVECDQWVMFECAENGDTTNKGKLRIYVVGCA